MTSRQMKTERYMMSDVSITCSCLEHMAMTIVKNGIKAQQKGKNSFCTPVHVPDLDAKTFSILHGVLSLNLIGMNLPYDWDPDMVCFSWPLEFAQAVFAISRDSEKFMLSSTDEAALENCLRRFSCVLSAYEDLNRTLCSF